MENKNLPQQNVTIMDAIRDKIKGSFVDIIPDTNWDALVKAEVDAFFEQPCEFVVESVRGGYGQADKNHFKFEGTNPTMFRTMVWDMCVEKTREHLKSEHIDKIMVHVLDSQFDEATGKTKNLITDAIPLMIQSYFENISRGMMHELAMKIQTNANNNYQTF